MFIKKSLFNILIREVIYSEKYIKMSYINICKKEHQYKSKENCLRIT